MGDKFSIQFKKGEERSVVVFAEWEGEFVFSRVNNFVRDLKAIANLAITEPSVASPLTRGDMPLLVGSLVFYINEVRSKHLRIFPPDFRNWADNGHWTIDADTLKILREKP